MFENESVTTTSTLENPRIAWQSGGRSSSFSTSVKTVSNKENSKVLIIDDDEAIRKLVHGGLTKSGFEVITASEGEQGIALASQRLPDLIVCDLAMPGMDGFEVLTALRRDVKLADTPVIFLTGQSEPSQVRAGMNSGADDYLTKPVDLDDLLGTIRARLTRRQAEKVRREKQIERAMQAFAQIVHDLRDPLFVVLGCADLLQSGGLPLEAGSERSKALLSRMQKGVLRLQSIISETLFLAKSRMQELPFDPVPLDLRDFCLQIVANHEGRERLQLQIQPTPHPLVADPLRLQQALENLLSNGLKYSEGPVDVSVEKIQQGYRICIRDRGIGIPPDEWPNIFEPFFRASNTSSKPGHGLGLSIVKGCIEQQGGKISFLSELTKGSTFIIEMPKQPSELPHPDPSPCAPLTTGQRASNRATERELAPAKSGQPPLPRTTGAALDTVSSMANLEENRLTSIIVDDDPLVRSVLRDLLDNSPEVVVLAEAATLAQARTLVEHHKPAVVFLDVTLPDGTGFELLSDMEPGTSVVFVTSAEDHAVQAFDCEAADYLLKPVSLERLQQALQQVRRRISSKPQTEGQTEGSFLVKTLTEKRLVEYREIRSIVAYGEYSRVTWNKDKGALLRKSLKQWQAELPASHFVRVHRQAIVNLAFMERIEKLPGGKMRVHVKDMPKPFPVSLRLAPMLNRKLRSIAG